MKERESLDKDTIGKSFSSAVQDVVGTMAGIEVIEINSDNVDQNKADVDQISGAMLLLGTVNSMMSITLSSEAASTLVSYMTGISASDLESEELFDGVAELVNMICGRVKAILAGSEFHFKLTSPFAVTGRNHMIIHKTKVAKLIKRYDAGEWDIVLKVFFL